MTATAQRGPRTNGQWLVDGRTPLNANEVFKAEDNDPLAVRARIEGIYALQGFDSIPTDDLHGRRRRLRRPGVRGEPGGHRGL